MEIIETIYYDQKTFWPFHSYTAQNCKGIEILVNLVSISYYTIKFLPYQNEHFLNTAKTYRYFFRIKSKHLQSDILVTFAHMSKHI